MKIGDRTLDLIFTNFPSNVEVKSLFRQPISPTTHYYDSPFLRQPIIPTAHFSDNPSFRQPITPTMTNIYINFVIFLKPGPGAIKHENFLKW